jgi:acetoin utilization deacetylase AcuC-like enzyme
VSGFCTFNGLMVTAAVLHAEGAKRIGILDCDHHYGDGTHDIIEKLGARGWVNHYTAGRHYGSPSDAREFFARLPEVLRSFSGCDVVLYQAGADPHLDDPLGGWLSTEQLLERDRLVFQTLAAQRTPVAWNLAGGYQVEPDGSIPRVLEIHDNTLRACAEVYLD